MANDSRPTFFIEDASVTLREAEVPNANFGNGMNLAGSCAPAIGVNVDAGAVEGSPEQFTLLDQRVAARTPQISQHIGGAGYSAKGTSSGNSGYFPEGSVRAAIPSVSGDGVLQAPRENVGLAVLANGWLAPVV